jgi:hypothetical protein
VTFAIVALWGAAAVTIRSRRAVAAGVGAWRAHQSTFTAGVWLGVLGGLAVGVWLGAHL